MRKPAITTADERKILKLLVESVDGLDCGEIATRAGMRVVNTYHVLSALHRKKLTIKNRHEREDGVPTLLHAVSPLVRQTPLPEQPPSA